MNLDVYTSLVMNEHKRRLVTEVEARYFKGPLYRHMNFKHDILNPLPVEYGPNCHDVQACHEDE
jgi:hypothetical protein